ncbi:MAG: hypothetical protein JSS51_01370 [Planctomycetes bacterium]|nr:hypothetical protein [Planctomycetota bacterium]
MSTRIAGEVIPGAPIRAEDLNRIVDGLARRFQVTTGPGLRATMGANGLFLALTGVATEWIFPARIVRVIKANPNASPTTPDFPDNISYEVKVIGEGGASILPIQPSFGRPVKNVDATFTKIYPAAVGAFCFILRDRDSNGAIVPKLILFSGGSDGETVLHELCS